MQDGSYQKGQGIDIATCSYPYEDASSLFSIIVSINSKFDKIGKNLCLWQWTRNYIKFYFAR